jgi:hypothetical protein
VAVEEERGAVVGGCEGAEPLARPLSWLPDLRHPLAPTPLPHAAVPEVAIPRPALACLATLLVVGCSVAAAPTLGDHGPEELAVVGFQGARKWHCISGEERNKQHVTRGERKKKCVAVVGGKAVAL